MEPTWWWAPPTHPPSHGVALHLVDAAGQPDVLGELGDLSAALLVVVLISVLLYTAELRPQACAQGE